MNISKDRPTSTLSICIPCMWPHLFSLLDGCWCGEIPLTVNTFSVKTSLSLLQRQLLQHKLEEKSFLLLLTSNINSRIKDQKHSSPKPFFNRDFTRCYKTFLTCSWMVQRNCVKAFGYLVTQVSFLLNSAFFLGAQSKGVLKDLKLFGSNECT